MGSEKFQKDLMRLQGNLLNFAYMLTSNRDDAYDLLQDTTLKALDNEAKYTENTNLKGWVFTIMRNIFINNYRRGARAATVTDSTDNLFYLNISQDSGLDTPEGSYTASEITDAINAFPDEYRVPFSMHVAGYKYNEIADKMSLPLGTVKSRIFFARKKTTGTIRRLPIAPLHSTTARFFRPAIAHAPTTHGLLYIIFNQILFALY